MRINKIELYNIGSYEGRNYFDISSQNEAGKIVLVGGKNGAGKTTLFTAIKLCLYGYKESGYQAINAFYKKQIKKLINDKAKLENNGQAFVMLDISIHNGHEWDNYFLKRFWSMKDDSFEHFEVWKNDEELTVEEVSDFENYLLNLIPPELFELYFFDGEQIADFFLENSGNERVKQAFLTLCGYDTFDILLRNFKRINKNATASDDILGAYLDAEDSLYVLEKNCKKCTEELEIVNNEIEIKNMELKSLEEKYTQGGGVTVVEWNEKFLELKNEERYREERNAWLRMAANDIIPYIILQAELKKLLEIIDKEREFEQLETARNVLKSMLPDIMLELKQDEVLADKICGLLDERISEEITGEPILNLSKDEYSKLSAVINTLLGYKKEDVIKVRNELRSSINRSKKIRELIENSSVQGIDSFLERKQAFIEEREKLIEKREILNIEFVKLMKEKEESENNYKRVSKELEKQLKTQSINSLSAKSILFLEELQQRLFKSEIVKVQDLFMKKLNELMRKKQFIDSIEIDEEFNVKAYKKVSISCNGVSKKIRSLSCEGYQKEYGHIHCNDLLKVSGCVSLEEFSTKYSRSREMVEVLVEFDKSTMSKGEKQVFIMSLYWAMMQLCNKEIPFIIDTPFARIDTEHRAHITKYFFKELSGQVFIFSTNEEIMADHVEVIGDDLQATFLIENIDNKKTLITSGKYFEEE